MFDRDVRLLSLFTGKNEDYFNSLTPDEFGKYRKELYKVVSEEPTKAYKPVLTIGGRKFSFVVSVNQVTARELADLHLLNITPDNYYSNVPAILALFGHEKRGWRFWRKPLNFTQKVELFKDLPADDGNSISLFFCQVYPKLESVIRTYLDQQMREAANNLRSAISGQYSTGGGGMR